MNLYIKISVYILIVMVLSILPSLSQGQNCIGGQIYTKEAYQYGRFEVSMQSAAGNGVVSSFFLYNLDLNCNWPAENNEIDIEMTGNNDSLHFTTHYPGPWYYSDKYVPNFSPHDTMIEYAFEWEPGIVRWFVEGQLVNVQNQPFVGNLIYPMRIMMNLWAANSVSWVGVWNPAVMPVSSRYEYVKYYDYVPGSGNTGTNNNFMLSWEEHFDSLNHNRWLVEENGGFGGNYCTFRASSVEVDNGQLKLKLEDEQANSEMIPVTFSADLRSQNLLPSDVIYLAGTFNNWCGNCNPMNNNNGIWSVTLNLPPGPYEYIFTKNFWQENGAPPIESECDYNPCDQYANYGLMVSYGAAEEVTDTFCWNSCYNCEEVSVPSVYSDKISSTSARLNWVPESNCQYSFTIRGKELNQNSWVYINVPNSDPHYKDVSGLKNNKTYVWQVKAQCTNSLTYISDWSELDTFTTHCQAPDTLWTDIISKNSVKLNWSGSSGAYGYEVQGGLLSSSGLLSIISPGSSTEYNVFNLTPNSSYRWKVRAFCSNTGSYSSVFTDWSTFTTPQQKMENEYEYGDSDITLYPNPAHDEISIFLDNFTSGEEYVIEIYNLQGQRMYYITSSLNPLPLNVSSFPSGPYIITVTGDSKMLKGILHKQ